MRLDDLDRRQASGPDGRRELACGGSDHMVESVHGYLLWRARPMRDLQVVDLDRERERTRPEEVGLAPESGARHAFRCDAM